VTPEPEPGPDRREEHVRCEVIRREERKLRSRSEPRVPWIGLRMFGMVGWAVTVPTLLGLAAGRYLDSRWAAGGPVSWTLTLLIMGVIVGCLNAWYWVAREARLDAAQPRGTATKGPESGKGNEGGGAADG